MARVRLALIASALALPLCVPSLRAQEIRTRAYGVHAGVTVDDPAQLLVGGQVDLGRLGTNVRFQPLVTVGVGGDAVTVLAGAEAHYLFPTAAKSRLQPYLGGGVGVFHVNNDAPGVEDPTDVALLVSGGVDVPVERWWSWFAEGRFIVADGSLFRLEAGIDWKY